MNRKIHFQTIQKVLKEALGLKGDNRVVFHDATEEALDEAKEAIQKVGH